MIKNLSFSTLFLLLTNMLLAQKITGIVLYPDGKPAEFATVLLLHPKDSSLVKGAVADMEGQYEISGNLPLGSYFLKASVVGFKETYSLLFELQQNYAAPLLKLTATSTDMKEVTIVAKKPMIEVKADKTILNVEGNLTSTGKNALELLRKAPGVVVDKDDNISMRGKNGVAVYIDNKPTNLSSNDLASILKGMQASDIEAIELITNPSAKYDAAGNAGIINIRLKKNKNLGTNGNFALGGGYGQLPKANASFNFNHRNKKVNVFGNLSGYAEKSFEELSIYRTQNNVIYDQNTRNLNNAKSANYKAGIDVFLNDKNTLGFLSNGNLGDFLWKSNSRTQINAPNSEKEYLIASNSNPNNNRNINLNTNYRFADTLGHVLTVDLDYGNFTNQESSFLPNYYKNATEKVIKRTFIYRINKPTNVRIKTIKSDYEQELGTKGKYGKLGIGLKIASVETNNQFDFYDVLDIKDVLNKDRTNTFDYTENVKAAYANYNVALSKKWNLQSGLRIEQTHSLGNLMSFNPKPDDRVERTYTNLFPSAALTFAASEKHQFNINYSRRIDRPQYNKLNPFENRLDELTYQKGNPFLRPQYSNNVDLSHTFMGFLTTTLNYSHTKDFTAQLTDTTELSRTFVIDRNIANVNMYGINVGAPLPIAKWWEGYLNINIYNIRYNADFGAGKILNAAQTSANIYSEHTFSLGKGFKYQVSGWYNSPMLWGAFNINKMWSVDMAIQKKCFGDRGSLRLSLDDVFLTNRMKGFTNFGGVDMQLKSRNETRVGRLSFSYRFGGNEVAKARDRKTGLEDEAKRVGKGK